MPTPATTQGTWTPNTAHGVDGTYSGTVSEMPTPDLLGREWNVNQQQAPVEMGTPTPTVAVWGARQDSLPRAQNWNGPVDPHKFDGQGLGMGQQATAVGLPLSLKPGKPTEHRAELA